MKSASPIFLCLVLLVISPCCPGQSAASNEGPSIEERIDQILDPSAVNGPGAIALANPGPDHVFEYRCLIIRAGAFELVHVLPRAAHEAAARRAGRAGRRSASRVRDAVATERLGQPLGALTVPTRAATVRAVVMDEADEHVGLPVGRQVSLGLVRGDVR